MSTEPATSQAAPLLLSPVEARILGTLMEKARTVPDSYPLSLNALMLGCNQKNSRDPTMNLSESEIATAMERLLSLNLVRQASGSRVARYEHNFQRGIGVPEQSAVLLGLLMLRGPQTAAELRLNAERWYRFADISSVEGFLEELQERPEHKGGALTVKLPRAPGAREQRWAHLLCGPVSATAWPTQSAESAGATADHALLERIARLERELAELQETVQRLCTELGVPSMHP